VRVHRTGGEACVSSLPEGSVRILDD